MTRAARRREAARAAGFTLVELLIALALLGLLSLAIFGELRFGTHAWSAVARVDQEAETIGAVQALLRLKLQTAYPMLTRATDLSEAGGERHVDFDGARDALGFVSFLPDRAGPPVTARLTLRAEPTPDGDALRLVAAWRPALGPGNDGAAPVGSVLLERIAALRFSYYGVPEGRTAPEWTDSWTQRRDLPQLVSVTVAFPDGDRRRWPELIVAPRIRADVTCVFDPLIKDCRQR